MGSKFSARGLETSYRHTGRGRGRGGTVPSSDRGRRDLGPGHDPDLDFPERRVQHEPQRRGGSASYRSRGIHKPRGGRRAFGPTFVRGPNTYPGGHNASNRRGHHLLSLGESWQKHGVDGDTPHERRDAPTLMGDTHIPPYKGPSLGLRCTSGPYGAIPSVNQEGPRIQVRLPPYGYRQNPVFEQYQQGLQAQQETVVQQVLPSLVALSGLETGPESLLSAAQKDQTSHDDPMENVSESSGPENPAFSDLDDSFLPPLRRRFTAVRAPPFPSQITIRLQSDGVERAPLAKQPEMSVTSKPTFTIPQEEYPAIDDLGRADVEDEKQAAEASANQRIKKRMRRGRAAVRRRQAAVAEHCKQLAENRTTLSPTAVQSRMPFEDTQEVESRSGSSDRLRVCLPTSSRISVSNFDTGGQRELAVSIQNEEFGGYISEDGRAVVDEGKKEDLMTFEDEPLIIISSSDHPADLENNIQTVANNAAGGEAGNANWDLGFLDEYFRATSIADAHHAKTGPDSAGEKTEPVKSGRKKRRRRKRKYPKEDVLAGPANEEVGSRKSEATNEKSEQHTEAQDQAAAAKGPESSAGDAMPDYLHKHTISSLVSQATQSDDEPGVCYGHQEIEQTEFAVRHSVENKSEGESKAGALIRPTRKASRTSAMSDNGSDIWSAIVMPSILARDPATEDVVHNCEQVLVPTHDPQDHLGEHETARSSQVTNPNRSSVQKSRMKLDVKSSRRLVFGALGLRVPKINETSIEGVASEVPETQTAEAYVDIRASSAQVLQNGKPEDKASTTKDDQENLISFRDPIPAASISATGENDDDEASFLNDTSRTQLWWLTTDERRRARQAVRFKKYRQRLRDGRTQGGNSAGQAGISQLEDEVDDGQKGTAKGKEIARDARAEDHL
ncbi:MAG: hypothetical protein Q9213_002895 [Squamulea squamosa]